MDDRSNSVEEELTDLQAQQAEVGCLVPKAETTPITIAFAVSEVNGKFGRAGWRLSPTVS